MRRIMLTIIFIFCFITIFTFRSYTEEISEEDKEDTVEEIFNTNCQWVLIALEGNNLELAKKQYYTVCNNPKYKGKEGYTWLTFAVWNEAPDQVAWALSLPDVNINDKFGGQTVLYKTVLNMYHNNIESKDHPRYKILQMLLKHNADPMFKNDTEGDPPYSNGESTFELIKRINVANTSYGQLVLQSLNKKSGQTESDIKDSNDTEKDYDHAGKFWKLKESILEIDAPTIDAFTKAVVEGLSKYHEDFPNADKDWIVFTYGTKCKVVVKSLSKELSPDKETLRITISVQMIDKFGTIRTSNVFRYDIDKKDGRWKSRVSALDTDNYSL